MKRTVLFIFTALLPALSHADAFDRMKELAGTWEGSSTKGWTERQSVRTIARGSAVLFTGEFTGGNEGMATVVHRDGPTIILTHYCEAGNQPTLKLVKADGDTFEFAFLRAGNLASRDVGHMDRLVLRFIDRDHYTERWTWYQDGKEKWLEEITYRREQK